MAEDWRGAAEAEPRSLSRGLSLSPGAALDLRGSALADAELEASALADADEIGAEDVCDASSSSFRTGAGPVLPRNRT